MALSDVINNIEEKGLHETHRIYLCRKYNLVPKEEHTSLKKSLKKTLRENESQGKKIELYEQRLDSYEQQLESYRDQMDSFNFTDYISSYQFASNSKLLAAYHKKLLILCIMRSIIKQNGWNIDKVNHLMDDVLTSATGFEPKKIDEWDARIAELEKKKYRRELKRLFIKKLIPETYKENSDSDINERKIVFLQPRKGLNQTFKYIYHQMQSGGEYDPKLIELYRGEVSMTEHYLNALKFAKEAATAKAIMVHESSEYLGHIDIRPETKVIQLWHGCGIIKHLGLTNAGKPGYKTLEEYEEFPEYNKYDLVTIAGEGLRGVFEDFMGKEKDDPVIQAMGMSRTDEFFDDAYIDNCYRKLYERIPEAKEKKIILYAPTYRNKGAARIAPRELDIEKFAESLSDEYILIIKQHQTAKDVPEIPEEYRDRFAYDMTRGRGMDINELMTVSDICISDYSSVVFEFSLFERPIIFFMYDLDEYGDTRGLYYSYEELAECGPIFKTNEEMIDYIINVEEKFDKSKVVAFREKYMSACDGHATERILRYIGEDAI